MRKVLITGSNSLDMDSLACSVAYARFLSAKDPATTYLPFVGNTVHPEVKFICKKLNIGLKQTSPTERFDKFVLVDASEPKGLPELVRTDDVIEVIDHRMFAEYKAFPNAKFRIEPIGAAATQVAEKFYFDNSVSVAADTAALLLCAIYSNTINFKSDTTTFRDLRMKDWLAGRVGENFKNLPLDMYEYKSVQAISDIREALASDAKDNCEFGLAEPVVLFQIETIRAGELIKYREKILRIMNQLFPNRKHQLLLIQDAKHSKTLLVTDSEPIVKVLIKTRLPLKGVGTMQGLEIPNIVMRKSLQQACKDNK